MLISCKNCGGHFTETEMRVRPPPAYPWQLTLVGQRVLIENEQVPEIAGVNRLAVGQGLWSEKN